MTTRGELERKYWKERKSIRKIAQEINSNYTTTRQRMMDAGIKRRGHTPNQPPQLDLTMNPNLAYILGVCYGDGSVCKYFDKSRTGQRFIRHIISLEVLENKLKIALEFKSALDKIGFRPSFSVFAPKGSYRVRQYSREFYSWFKSLSIDGLRRLLSSELLMNEFVRGFYECEGCLSRYIEKKRSGQYIRYQLSISNNNLKILLFIKDYLGRRGISFGINKRIKRSELHNDNYLLYISAEKKIARFLEIIKPHIKNEFNPHIPISQGLAERRRER